MAALCPVRHAPPAQRTPHATILYNLPPASGLSALSTLTRHVRPEILTPVMGLARQRLLMIGTACHEPEMV